MKIVQNKLADAILFRGYSAITLWPFIFVRTTSPLTHTLINHEMIHGKQQAEMWLIGFYVWYLSEWLIKLLKHGRKAYRNISFEREAYKFENKLSYLDSRHPWAWLKFVGRKN